LSVFISCGEPSGDHYAALLIGSLRKITSRPIFGMLGKEGQQAGGEALWSIDQLSLMGTSDIISAIPRLLSLKKTMVDYVLQKRPERIVVIDSPDFHIPLIRSLRKKGYKKPIFYIAPPTVWAWRSRRIQSLRRYCTAVFPLLRFEHLFMIRHGVPSVWKGHPFLDEYGADSVTEPSSRTIALLPGSRKGEVKRLLPVLLECAALFKEKGYNPVFSIAPSFSSKYREDLKGKLISWDIFEGKGIELMKKSCLVIGASGTAALEAMMVNRFMVVMYKGSFMSWFIYKMMVKTPWVSLPNIMAGEQVYPELLQKKASSHRVMEEALAYLSDPLVAARKHADLARARSGMGESGAVALWAETILRGEVQ
jgi:lipid-A-disaccharide synthase